MSKTTKKKLTLGMGRPKKLPEAWSDKIRENILEEYKNGGSNTDAVALLDISERTFYEILAKEKKDPIELDFSQAIKRGNVLSKLWWEKLSRTPGMFDSKMYNPTVYAINMNNRFKKGGYDGSWSMNKKDDNDDKRDEVANVSFNQK